MTPDSRKQLIALGLFVAFYALLAFMAYLLTPLDQLAAPGQTVPAATSSMPRWQLAATGAGFVLVVYGLLGLAGSWFAAQAGTADDVPAGGRLASLAAVADGDRFALRRHPGNHGSGLCPSQRNGWISASGVSPIRDRLGRGGNRRRNPVSGFRHGVVGVSLQPGSSTLEMEGRPRCGLATCLAALAVSASHIPAAMLLLKVASPAAIPAPAMTELFLLNGSLGLGGRRALYAERPGGGHGRALLGRYRVARHLARVGAGRCARSVSEKAGKRRAAPCPRPRVERVLSRRDIVRLGRALKQRQSFEPEIELTEEGGITAARQVFATSATR